MKTKLVLPGTDANDKKILIAIELIVADNKVKMWTFPEAVATPELEAILMEDWRSNKEVAFPEGFTLIEKELSVTDSLLPEDIKTERTDLVLRAQTEWAFIVLSHKMSAMFDSELADLKEKVAGLDRYDSAVWNDLKNFWGKVQTQVKDRNLFREHADSLRDGTNALFGEMKEKRKKMDEEFKSASKEVSATFMTALNNIEEKVENGKGRPAALFEELKRIQRDFKDARLSRDDRSTIWAKIDAAFKVVKEKRFGKQAVQQGNNPADRVNRRLTGLEGAIEKMERSIGRDRDDLDFQKKRIDRADNQLEAQIRVAKIRMIEERVRSKEEKLNEMRATQKELETKAVKVKARMEKDAAVAKAKKEAEEKIAAEMAAKKEAQAADAEKLEAAADKIKGEKKKAAPKKADKPAPEAAPVKAAAAAAATVVAAAAVAPEPVVVEAKVAEDSTLEAVGTILTEGVEDAVDTIKAIAAVVGGKIEDAVVTLKEDIKEAAAEVSEKVEKATSEEE